MATEKEKREENRRRRMTWEDDDIEFVDSPNKKKKTENIYRWDNEAVNRAIKELEE